MDLTKFKFPEQGGIEGFSIATTNKELLAEAKKRGFYNGHTPYNKLFSNLFFGGGRVVFKKDIDEEFRLSA